MSSIFAIRKAQILFVKIFSICMYGLGTLSRIVSSRRQSTKNKHYALCLNITILVHWYICSRVHHKQQKYLSTKKKMHILKKYSPKQIFQWKRIFMVSIAQNVYDLKRCISSNDKEWPRAFYDITDVRLF